MRRVETPYAVRCPQHGKVGLTEAQRNTQLRYEASWTCPKCGAEAGWDDEHEENYPWDLDEPEEVDEWRPWTPPPRKVDVPGQLRLDGASLYGPPHP